MYFWKSQKCYKSFRAMIFWEGVGNYCQDNFHGELASISDNSTLQFMKKVVDSTMIDDHVGVTIGAMKENGEWHWSDGSKLEWDESIWCGEGMTLKENDDEPFHIGLKWSYNCFHHLSGPGASWIICQK